MSIGESIKLNRKQLGFKQKELAEMCGLSQNYLSEIENGHREPPVKTLRLIAEKLNRELIIIFN